MHTNLWCAFFINRIYKFHKYSELTAFTTLMYNKIKVVCVMKKTIKKTLILILSLLLLAINTNSVFAVEIVYPGVKIENPQFFDAASSTIDLSTYFNTEDFVNYFIEQLKVIDTSNSNGSIDVSQFI